MKRLVLIDSNAIVHKAFHAIPPLTNRDGEQVNAIYGFSSILLKIISDLNPDYIAATYDLPAPTFRHIEYDQYKAKRIKAPDELYEQIPKSQEILKGFNINVFEKEGYEADDVIGTIARKFSDKLEILILTGDLDTLQLIDENIRVYALRKGMSDVVIYDREKVFERYELQPNQMIDYKGLRGDPSDNIPGIKGVGEKTASVLLKEFHTIENMYKVLDKIKPSEIKKYKFLTPKLLERIRQEKQMAFFSKKLSTIYDKVPIDVELKDLDWKKGYDIKNAEAALDKYHFSSLINRLYGREGKPKVVKINPQQKLI
ncbi:MAG: 5'-3' exonuclease H3TH domain-containing protein [Patescibacteria group bacterium]